MFSAACYLNAVRTGTDLGSAPLYAPWGHNCWQGLVLASEDPERARTGLCYAGYDFRRATQKLEVITDGGWTH